jgi:hypothetical protein
MVAPAGRQGKERHAQRAPPIGVVERAPRDHVRLPPGTGGEVERGRYHAALLVEEQDLVRTAVAPGAERDATGAGEVSPAASARRPVRT